MKSDGHGTSVALMKLALLQAVLAPALLGSGQFRHPTYYRVGGNQIPYSATTAHFTGSGNTDIAVADYLTGKVSILLGNGDGTFQKPLEFDAPSPVRVEAGDFNEDSNEDLAVVESNGTADGAIAIFLGDGHGHFKLSAKYTVGIAPISVAVADFDGDGHLDVAVTNNGAGGPGSMMTFLGNGKGKLRDRRTYKLDGGPWEIAAGDLSGDNHSDVVVSLNDGESVVVFINDGTGKFLAPVAYDAGGSVIDVKIADLNHDGMNDIAAANISKNEIAIFLNKGDGTFMAAKFYVTGSSQGSGTVALAIADFNLDGNLDIAAVNLIGDAALLYGNHDGSFRTAIFVNDGVGPDTAYSIAAGDFNNDGAPDLTVPIEGKGKVAILLNTQ